MKKIISITLSLLLLFNVASIPILSNNAYADSDVVAFEDSGIEAAVRDTINKPSGEILKSDVQGITTLTAYNRNISSLAGIENLISLKYLNLEENKISNISSLSSLHNLSGLNLSKNNICDLSPLTNMYSLNWLNISRNQITDITYLSKLTNLMGIDISSNQIDNISSLDKLISLTSFVAERNNINDISPLSELSSLELLFIGLNEIKDISSLSKLTNLIQFSIGFNSQITDISVINNFTKLIYIDICGIQVNDISYFSKFTNLQALYANQTGNITDIRALSNLTKLTLLALNNNKITDISGLSKLTNLTYLDLSENQINSIRSLSGLVNLEQLYLVSCNISDIDEIENFTHMIRLYLYFNEITDINALRSLTNLTYLAMNENNVTDISPLRNLKNLKELTVGENPIHDYTVLKDIYNNLSFKDFTLRKLTSINITGADNITVPIDGIISSQYTAISKDQNGLAMDNLSVSWAVYDNIYNPVNTLSIDSNGILTASNTTMAGQYKIRAVSNSNAEISCTKDIAIIVNDDSPIATSIEINGSDTLALPPSRIASSNYTVSIKDQYGNQMSIQPVIWSIEQIGIPGVTVEPDTGIVTIDQALLDSTFTLKAALESNNSVVDTITVSIVREPVRVTQIRIIGPDKIIIPKLLSGPKLSPPFTAFVSSQWDTEDLNEQVEWSLVEPIPVGISLTDIIGKVLTFGINPATINSCSFILKAVSKSNSSISATKAVSLEVDSSLFPVDQLTEFIWTKGSTFGTTKATVVPRGTLKYAVGAANMQVRPNLGDASTAYTNILIANTDIAVTTGQHIFIVLVDNNEQIIKWSDIAVDSAYINSNIVEGPPPVIPQFPPVGGGFPPVVSSKPEPEKGVLTIVPEVTNNIGSIQIGLDDYRNLLDSATDTNGIKNLTINIDNTSLSTFNTQLPASALTSSTKDAITTMNTSIANVEVPSNMFDDTLAKNSTNIAINIAQVDKSNLPAEVARTIGNSPIVEISAIIDGIAKSWSNPNAPVKISIPYTLKKGEVGSNITVFYIDSTGKLENMQGIYNFKTNMVDFTTTHFSKYFVKENKTSFTDLSGFEEYSMYIENMASKGIIEGVGSNKYSPSKTFTRAEFATLLAKMLKLDTNSNKNVFVDVKSTNWYAPYVNAAYNAGLIAGIGTSRFAPNEVITNQDAAIILMKALKYKGFDITSKSLSNINDIKEISNYALAAVSFAVSNAIISLDDNSNFNSRSTVNRATAAKYIYNIFYFEN